jgi:hypothetical protein
MRTLLPKLALLALATIGCAGPSMMLGGEGVRTPEPPLPTLEIAVLAGDDLTPLPSASVVAKGEPVDPGRDGSLRVEWADEPFTLTVKAPGFKDASTTIVELPAEDEPFEVRLDPIIIRGSVLGDNGRPLPDARVVLGDSEVLTDEDGEFRFNRAVGDALSITRPAFEPETVEWSGESTLVVSLRPRMIRGLRIGADKAANPTEWRQLLDLAAASGVNAFVVDTKDESGFVYHDTGVAKAHEIGAVKPLYDFEELLADMDEAGLYTITRIVTFQDNFLAREEPSLAAKNTDTGEPWQNNKGLRWLDPTDRDSWEYALALAVEACRLGFDEVQFDYVRFPSDGPISKLGFDGLTVDDYYSQEKQQIRLETISAFLSEARSRLSPLGCATAADIFAITLESSTDEGIGQLPQVLSTSVDVLSPMIYSYTYGPGWVCEDPEECAVEIVERALDSGLTRLNGFAIYRPWLQRAFIDDEDILGVQNVAETRDLGWMLWSATTSFDLGHLPPPDGPG